MKANEPLTAGTPEITPVLEFNDKPDGSVPCAIQNLNGGNPPATRSAQHRTDRHSQGKNRQTDAPFLGPEIVGDN